MPYPTTSAAAVLPVLVKVYVRLVVPSSGTVAGLTARLTTESGAGGTGPGWVP